MAQQGRKQRKSKLPETKYTPLRLTVHCLNLLQRLTDLEGIRRGMIVEMAIRDRAEKKGVK